MKFSLPRTEEDSLLKASTWLGNDRNFDASPYIDLYLCYGTYHLEVVSFPIGHVVLDFGFLRTVVLTDLDYSAVFLAPQHRVYQKAYHGFPNRDHVLSP